MAHTTPTCCSRPLRRLDINAPGSPVSLLLCARCDTKHWVRDGAVIDRTDALAALGTVPSRPGRAGKTHAA
jgi:hypothetical protein